MTVESLVLAQQTTDLDSPWKYVLDFYFKDFMEYCLPDVAAQIDWSKGYELLDKELQTVAGEAKIGRRIADKLVKVWTKNGEETWILCHLEIVRRESRVFIKEDVRLKRKASWETLLPVPT